MGMIYVKRMCKKCFTDLKFMRIGEFRIPYCPKCTKPCKPKQRFWNRSPEQIAIGNRFTRDKKKVVKEVWAGKQTEIITTQHHRKLRKPDMYRKDGTLSDAYIKYRRKLGGSK